MARMRQSLADDLTLSQRLQWHAGQSLRRGVGCSVMVLQPLQDQDHRRVRALAHEAGERDTAPTTLEWVAARLRPVLRHHDLIEVKDGTGIGIVLQGADGAGARAVHRRISQALSTPDGPTAPGALIERLQLAVGIASGVPSASRRIPVLVRDMLAMASVPDQSLACLVAQRQCGDGPRRRGRAPAQITARSASPGARPRSAGIRTMPILNSSNPDDEETERLRLRANALGIPYMTLPERVPESLRRLLGADLLRELRAVPVGRTRGILTVAMHDPTDRAAIDRLASASGLTIFPVLANQRDLARTLA